MGKFWRIAPIICLLGIFPARSQVQPGQGVTQSGAVVTNDCAKWAGSNQISDSGAPCGSGSPTGAAGGSLTGTYPNPGLNVGGTTTGVLPAVNGGTGEAGTITGALKGNGTSPATQAACADLSNASASCATDATNATNISSGTLASARGGVDTTAWTTFTPTFTCGTATFTVTSARFKTQGKVTWISFDVTIASLGSCTNTITFTSPNAPQSGAGMAGHEVAVNGRGLNCAISPGSTSVQCAKSDASQMVVAEHYLTSGVYENQ